MISSLVSQGLEMIYAIKTSIINKIQDSESKARVEEYIKSKIKDYNPRSLKNVLSQIESMQNKIKELEEGG